MRRLVAPLFAVLALAGCGDDGYTAPEREVTMIEILENVPTFQTAVGHDRYVEAWDVVTEILDIDPTEPASYLTIGESTAIPNHAVSEMVVSCAWGAALQEGRTEPLGRVEERLFEAEGFEDLRARVLDNTGGGDCSTLDQLGIIEIERDMPGNSFDLPTQFFQGEVYRLQASIALELAPEIAEVVAG